jgi:hypothetical protein
MVPKEAWRSLVEAFQNKPILALMALAILAVQGVLVRLTFGLDGFNRSVLIIGLLCNLGLLIWTVGALATAEDRQQVEASRPAPLGLLQSDEALIQVVWKRSASLESAEVRAVSLLAKQFFGFAPNVRTDQIVGRPASKLMGRLEKYIAPPAPYWTDLGVDQQRVNARLSSGERAYAQVPVHFNKEHPFFAGKTFLPMIVERGSFEENGVDMEFRKAVYIDVTTIPMHLFREQAWYEVTRTMGTEGRAQLADDLNKIADIWKNRGHSERLDGEIRAVDDAVRLLRDSGGAEVIQCCASAGWFALWDTANSQHYDAAVRFLRDVAGIAQEAA